MAISEEEILNYADEIETLESFIEHVRLRPGMYIGPIGNEGFINMIREIIQNCFDEIYKGKAISKLVKVEFDETTKMITITDNGRGIPFDNLVRIFSQERTSSNYRAKEGVFKSGMNGMGSKIVNALSKVFIVESFILGKGRKVEFYDGVPWDKGNSFNEEEIKNPDIEQGTRITFIPSEVMEKETIISTSWQDVFNLIDLLLPLTVIGTTVEYEAIDLKGVVHKEKLENEDGLIKYIINMTKKPIIIPIIINNTSSDMKVDTILSYDSDDFEESILSFGNFCPTRSGTHVEGLRLGVQEYFRNYMNKVYLATSKKKLTIINQDIMTGLKSVISAAHIEPVFTGQAKEHLSNVEIKTFVKTSVIKGLEEWSKNNPKDLQKLCQYFKDLAEIREKSDKEKVKLTDKFTKSALTGLPSKFRDCTGTKEDGLECYIVEGDSAGGSAVNARLDKRQAIFPIRGKLPNAYKKTKDSLLQNEEVAGIITIAGCGYGKSCDPSKSRWDKFIIMTDADPDGAHIACLVLRLFLLYMLPMIEAGKLYKSVPPLYGIPKGKNMKYFTTKQDYIKYILNIFNTKYNMTFLDGSTISTEKSIDILYKNMQYQYELELFSDNLALNPELVEFVLMNRNNDFNQLQKIIKNKYRFVDVTKQDNSILVKGLIDNKIETLNLDKRFIDNAKNIIHYIDIVNRNMNYLRINNEITSIYNVMKLFNKESPNKLYRYKGLGEMDPDQLFESTMDPDKRTLIQYTVSDAKRELEEIRHYENNMNELLIGLDNLSRFDVIG